MSTRLQQAAVMLLGKYLYVLGTIAASMSLFDLEVSTLLVMHKVNMRKALWCLETSHVESKRNDN